MKNILTEKQKGIDFAWNNVVINKKELIIQTTIQKGIDTMKIELIPVIQQRCSHHKQNS